MTKLQEAFLNGFIKAAAGAGPAPMPPLGSPNQQPGQPQPMPQQGQPAQMPQQGGITPMQQPQQAGGNKMFYQLLSQFKQQNPVPQAPQAVPNQHLQPQMV
jgi:hypothetical protein